MPAVTVNLAVNVDASGAINVFTQPFAGITNELVASLPLPASDLYKGVTDGASLLQFTGVTNAEGPVLDDIVGSYNTTFAGNAAYKSALGGSIHGILNGDLTASSASIPFAAYGPEYRSYTSFGELALAAYSHYIFGHVDATAAIDNDTVFKAKMNGLGASDAKLGEKLAHEIFTAMNPTAVAKQVLGQDASRALSEDNDGPTGSDTGLQNLKFMSGDIVYVAITLKSPTLTVSSGAVPSGLYPGGTLPGAQVTYNVKFTVA